MITMNSSPTPRGPNRSTTRRRGGFTLIELLISVVVFGVVVTGAIAFMSTQNSAFTRGSDRMSALRNVRYAISTIETDLTTAGTNVVPGQPGVIYAGDDVIAFSADYTSNVVNDVSAVFVNPSLPTGVVTAPRTAVSIPNSTESWPDTVYEQSGVNSPAEMIIFYFALDTTTTRTDDYMLYRQINSDTPEVVARSLLKVGSEPFLSYRQLILDRTGTGRMQEMPDSLLPVFHEAPFNGSAADTGQSARIDSIRAVKINLAAYNRRSASGDTSTVSLSRTVDLPNAGMSVLQTCGDEPILGQAITATATVVDGSPAVDLAWTAAVDETGGEGDVVRYVIWRRVVGEDWADPFLSIPAGQATYTYQDLTVSAGTTYQYGLAAQDCTPSLSTRTEAVPVVIP